MPRRRFVGARNVATVKDGTPVPCSTHTGTFLTCPSVKFLGPNDDLVVSGSDDGNFFLWNKSDGDLQGIYEGDSSVVNVVEGHPYLPLVAVSGIDYTVKVCCSHYIPIIQSEFNLQIFSPTPSLSAFSRMAHAAEIIESNQRPRSPPTLTLSSLAALQLLARARSTSGNEIEIRPVECSHQ